MCNFSVDVCRDPRLVVDLCPDFPDGAGFGGGTTGGAGNTNFARASWKPSSNGFSFPLPMVMPARRASYAAFNKGRFKVVHCEVMAPQAA